MRLRIDLQTADAVAENHPNAPIIFPRRVEPGAFARLKSRRNRKLRKTSGPLNGAPVEIGFGVEIVDLRRDPTGDPFRRKRRDRTDSAAAGVQAFPESIHIKANRRYRAQSGDHNTFFHSFTFNF